jgi:hypothetical protein
MHQYIGGANPFTPILTINVPVVFMAGYLMILRILRGATSLRGALEGGGA